MDFRRYVYGVLCFVVGGFVWSSAVGQEKEKEKISYANQIQSIQMRCTDLENKFSDYDHFVKTQLYRTDELERKVSGVQKQITILHAKSK